MKTHHLLKNTFLALVILVSTFTFVSCKSPMNLENSINTQTQRVSSTLSRNEYTLLDRDASFTITNKKKYKKHNLTQLKEAAMMEAEKDAILNGADGILNPRYIVEQKRKKYIVTVRAKSYRLKSDNEYIDMENQLKHNPTGR